MKEFRMSRFARWGSGMTLAATLGITALLPGAPVSPAMEAVLDQVAVDEYVHVDYAKKSLSICGVRTGTDNTPLTEAWSLPAGGLQYTVETGLLPLGISSQQVKNAAAAAAAAWGPGITAAADGSNSVNTISFGAMPAPDVASYARMKITNGTIVEAQIVLDILNPWSTNDGVQGECGGDPLKWDIQNVLTHEFGHWVGARHPGPSANFNHRTMYSEIPAGELSKRSLSAGDIASIPSGSSSSSFSGTVTRMGDDDG